MLCVRHMRKNVGQSYLVQNISQVSLHELPVLARLTLLERSFAKPVRIPKTENNFHERQTISNVHAAHGTFILMHMTSVGATLTSTKMAARAALNLPLVLMLVLVLERLQGPRLPESAQG